MSSVFSGEGWCVMVLFGTDGVINHVTLIFGACYALGGLIFRKTIANDLLGMPFSFIGCLTSSMVVFTILDNLFDSIKVSVGFSLAAFLIGGFLLGSILPDGEADGSD